MYIITMKAIKAINKKTGKIRYFGSVKDIKEDSEISKGCSKYATQIISNALNPNTVSNGFNGWKLYVVSIDESSIKETKNDRENV